MGLLDIAKYIGTGTVVPSTVGGLEGRQGALVCVKWTRAHHHLDRTLYRRPVAH